MAEVELHYMLEGEHVLGDSTRLLVQAWHELPELQSRTLEQYLQDNIHLLVSYNRLEVHVVDNDAVVGGVVLVDLVDIHYGRVLCVMHAFGKAGPALKKAYEVGRELGFKWLMRSSRLSSTKYLTLYRRL